LNVRTINSLVNIIGKITPFSPPFSTHYISFLWCKIYDFIFFLHNCFNDQSLSYWGKSFTIITTLSNCIFQIKLRLFKTTSWFNHSFKIWRSSWHEWWILLYVSISSLLANTFLRMELLIWSYFKLLKSALISNFCHTGAYLKFHSLNLPMSWITSWRLAIWINTVFYLILWFTLS